MYVSGEKPLVDDIVRGNGDEGKVTEVTEHGVGGEQQVTVRWTTPHEKVSGSRIYAPKAPQSVAARLLRLMRRKTG
jgi:hypothetical protein